MMMSIKHSAEALGYVLEKLENLDLLWTDPPGFFARASYAPHVRIAFANDGVSIGLQAAEIWPERVEKLNA